MKRLAYRPSYCCSDQSPSPPIDLYFPLSFIRRADPGTQHHHPRLCLFRFLPPLLVHFINCQDDCLNSNHLLLYQLLLSCPGSSPILLWSCFKDFNCNARCMCCISVSLPCLTYCLEYFLNTDTLGPMSASWSYLSLSPDVNALSQKPCWHCVLLMASVLPGFLFCFYILNEMTGLF